LKGTYEALPKGGFGPKQRELEVRIGPPLLLDALKPRVKGLARSESYRLVTRLCEEAVHALKDGKIYTLEPMGEPPGLSEATKGHA